MKPIKLVFWGLLLVLAAVVPACTPEMSTQMLATTPSGTALPATTTASRPTQTATHAPSDTPSPTITPAVTPTQTTPCIENIFVPEGFVPGSQLLLARKDPPDQEVGLQVIDLQSGQVEAALIAPKPVYRAEISPDGRTLAWALEDNSIQLLSFPDGELLHEWNAHEQRIDGLKFAPDGQRLYSVSYDGWVRAWNMQGELVSEIAPGGLEVHAIGISPDGRLAGIVSFEGPQKLWDLETGQAIAELSPNGAFSAAEVVFSGDGALVGLSLGGGPVSLWTVPEGELVWSGGNFSLAFSPDGRYLVYSDVNADGSNKVVIAAPSGSETIRTLEGQPSFAWKLLFSPDSSLLVEGSDAVRVWEVESGELVVEFKAECP